MDFFEFAKNKPDSVTQSMPSPIKCNADANTEWHEGSYIAKESNYHFTHIQLQPDLTYDPYVPPIRRIQSKTQDIVFLPNEPGSLNPTVLFLDYSSSMISLGNEPPDSCKQYIQTLYNDAINENDPEIREKLLNVNVRLIVFNETYREILNNSVRNLNKPTFEYLPVGMTDLYSPVYDVMISDPTPKDVIIVSDGQNNSGPHRSEYMSRQFENAINAGWSIKFIGCTLDSISESNKLNLRQHTYNCSENEGAIPIGSIMRCISEQSSQSNRQRSTNSDITSKISEI